MFDTEGLGGERFAGVNIERLQQVADALAEKISEKVQCRTVTPSDRDGGQGPHAQVGGRRTSTTAE
jgi:hypothetical protein